MHGQAARAAINEIIFATASERLGPELARTTLSVFCECASEACDLTLSLTAEQYLAALAEPGRHVVVPEHRSGGERLVLAHESFLLVKRPVRV
jgi:hypothetical protein